VAAAEELRQVPLVMIEHCENKYGWPDRTGDDLGRVEDGGRRRPHETFKKVSD
jgi:hypothetical protein